jgi:hypothetical protein
MSQNESFEQDSAQHGEERGAPKRTEDLSSPGETGFDPYTEAIESERTAAPEGYLAENPPVIPDLPQTFSSAPFPDRAFPDQEPLIPEEPTYRPLFQSFTQLEIIAPTRIPHLGHLCLLAVLAIFGLLCASLVVWAGMHYRLFGVSTLDMATTEVHYAMGSEAVLYLTTFAACLFIFPLVWGQGFFAGLHWNAATALRLRWRLFGVAAFCILLAIIDGVALPGPTHAPIDKLFSTTGAAWLMFTFGVTFAPFFEEITFRGFLLPALATAWDWSIEQATGKPAPPLDANGNPQWSLFAMIFASVLTSLPFALIHVEQQGHAWGPFILLIAVSLVLCGVRLRARSLAASVVVHATYNFLLFSAMAFSTGGFRHLDKM